MLRRLRGRAAPFLRELPPLSPCCSRPCSPALPLGMAHTSISAQFIQLVPCSAPIAPAMRTLRDSERRPAPPLAVPGASDLRTRYATLHREMVEQAERAAAVESHWLLYTLLGWE